MVFLLFPVFYSLFYDIWLKWFKIIPKTEVKPGFVFTPAAMPTPSSCEFRLAVRNRQKRCEPHACLCAAGHRSKQNDDLLGHADTGGHFSLFQLMLQGYNFPIFGASDEKKTPTLQEAVPLTGKQKAENILFQRRKSSGRWYPQDRPRIVQQHVQMSFFYPWRAQLPFPGTKTINLRQRSQE